jgi:hypothetical protein
VPVDSALTELPPHPGTSRRYAPATSAAKVATRTDVEVGFIVTGFM